MKKEILMLLIIALLSTFANADSQDQDHGGR